MKFEILMLVFVGVVLLIWCNVLFVKSGSGVINVEVIMFKNVGVIGLGVMGYGVVSLLLCVGFNVYVCDVCKEVLDKFVVVGGVVCVNLVELVVKVDVVIILVVNVV